MSAIATKSGLALEGIGDLASLLEQPNAESTGGPLELALELIDEDPNQPRSRDNPGFSIDSLKELAATIRARGVKTPISVRVHPHAPGRYLINHGARRVRASRMAEKTTIPAFIDNDYNEADQVIENLQRNDLTPREIADYIGRELAKGFKKGEIAKALGKSASFVSQHVTLLDLPDRIAEAFNSGRTRDVTVINDLVTVFKRRPTEVTDWLADPEQEVTRGTVRLLREYIEEKRELERERRLQDPPAGDDPAAEDDAIPVGADADDSAPPVGELDTSDDFDAIDPVADLPESALPAPAADAAVAARRLVDPYDRDPEPVASPRSAKGRDPEAVRKAIVQIQYDGRPGRLVLERRPPAPGYAWVRYDDDGAEVEADLAQVRLVALVEA